MREESKTVSRTTTIQEETLSQVIEQVLQILPDDDEAIAYVTLGRNKSYSPNPYWWSFVIGWTITHE